MTTAAKPKPTVRVRGVTYRSPDDAYTGAALIEHEADELAAAHRRAGRDGDADTVQDRGHADAETLRSWARGREAGEAEAADQPEDTPTEPTEPAGRGRSLRRPAATPRARKAVRSTRRYAGRAVNSTGVPQTVSSLLLQIAGLTIVIAFLTLLLTDRGVQAFGGLTGSAARGLAWFIDPTDPLAPHKHNHVASARASAYGRSGAATRPPTGPRR